MNCEKCGGTGMCIEMSCSSCKGSGVVEACSACGANMTFRVRYKNCCKAVVMR